jgi:beta-glucosidase
MKYKVIIDNLTPEEKVRLITGKNVWETYPIERLNIPSVFMADGPHGIRRQVDTGDNLGINQSYPSTLYPSSSLSGCSFDENLMFELGKHLAMEAKEQGVNLVLGPGINIKRHPLGGRNFEYFSEDPLVSGRLAKAWIKGIESEGVGACVKHFTCNNQETNRFLMNSLVDERTLNEIYLRPFKIALEAKPSALMTSYNRLNGRYVHANADLIKKVRTEWGFQGCLISDWGAVDDRVASLAGGLDLEMPSSGDYYFNKIKQAIKQKTFSERSLDEAVNHVLDLVFKLGPKKPLKPKGGNESKYHELAYRIASESMVLLQNKGILPLKKPEKVMLIGDLLKKPRLQGGGSSHIIPRKVDYVLDLIDNYASDLTYLENETDVLKGNCQTELEQAEKIILVLGLNEEDETEGTDRVTLDLPLKQRSLVEKLKPYLGKTVLVLMTGSVVIIPERENFGGVVLAGLMGQAGAKALLDILYGTVNPSGKLTETYADALEDYPATPFFGGKTENVPYAEGIFVGYRYFLTKPKEVAYPFGYGLSYTEFRYQTIKGNRSTLTEGTNLKVTVSVANVGAMAGKETVQLYLRKVNSRIIRPNKVLIDFQKVLIQPGKTAELDFFVPSDAFAVYDEKVHDYIIEPGEYEIIAGGNCLDEPLVFKVFFGKETEAQINPESLDEYMRVEGLAQRMGSLPTIPKRKRPYTLNDSFRILRKNILGRLLFAVIKNQALKLSRRSREAWMKKVIKATLLDTPLRTLAVMSSGALTLKQAEGLIDLINGKFSSGIKKLKNKA